MNDHKRLASSAHRHFVGVLVTVVALANVAMIPNLCGESLREISETMQAADYIQERNIKNDPAYRTSQSVLRGFNEGYYNSPSRLDQMMNIAVKERQLQLMEMELQERKEMRLLDGNVKYFINQLNSLFLEGKSEMEIWGPKNREGARNFVIEKSNSNPAIVNKFFSDMDTKTLDNVLTWLDVSWGDITPSSWEKNRIGFLNADRK